MEYYFYLFIYIIGRLFSYEGQWQNDMKEIMISKILQRKIFLQKPSSSFVMHYFTHAWN